jgi:hypothetical protein
LGNCKKRGILVYLGIFWLNMVFFGGAKILLCPIFGCFIGGQIALRVFKREDCIVYSEGFDVMECVLGCERVMGCVFRKRNPKS